MRGRTLRVRGGLFGAPCALGVAFSLHTACTRSSQRTSDAEARHEPTFLVAPPPLPARFAPEDGAHVARTRAWWVRVESTGDVSLASERVGAAAASVRLRTELSGLPVAPAKVFPVSPTVVAVERGVAREELETSPRGLEQRWVFPSAPWNRGPQELRVTVQVSGASYAGRPTSGHHFVASDGSGISYGEAFWVDARQQRTAVDVHWAAGSLSMVLPEALLARSSYPAVLDPIVTPEVAIDAPVADVALEARSPRLVQGPTGNFLALWWQSNRFVANRFDLRGQPVGRPVLLPLTNLEAASWDPAHGLWLVAGSSETHTGVDAVRLDAQGALLDTRPIPVPTGAPTRTFALTSNGLRFWLATTGGTASAMHVTPVETDGRVGAPLLIGEGGVTRAIACSGSACEVLWTSVPADQLRVTRLETADGGVLSTVPLTSTTTSGGYGIVFADGHFAVTWCDPSSRWRAARLTPAGACLGSDCSVPLTVSPPLPSCFSTTSPTWNGGSVALGWADDVALFGRALSIDGGLSGQAPTRITGDAGPVGSPSLAASGQEFVAAWSRGDRIYARELGADLTPRGDPNGVLLSRGTNSQRGPAVARTNTGFIVAWSDSRAGESEVFAARLDATGATIGAPFRLGTGDHPALASSGTHAAAVWTARQGTSHELRGQVFSATDNGTSFVLESKTDGILHSPAIVFHGTGYLVAWIDDKYAPVIDSTAVVGARLRPDGSVEGELGFPISTALGAHPTDVAAAVDGTNAFVVWSDGRNDPDSGDIFGARVSRDGTVLDIPALGLAAGPWSQQQPRVTWDGTQFIVAYLENGETFEYRPRLVRVSAKGQVLAGTGGLPLDSASAIAVAPMGDGVNDLVAWATPKGIRGTFVDVATGGVLDPAGITLAPAEDVEDVALAPNTPGSLELFYSAFSAGELAYRVAHRTVGSGLVLGEPCSEHGECQTRACRDGVCCNELCSGPCRTCGPDGQCTEVRHRVDPDTCSGAFECNANGDCGKRTGELCADGRDCSSGYCVDGFCCNQACDGPCDVCNDDPGICGPAPAGARGSPACAPYVCDGLGPTCAASCIADTECSNGFACDRSTKTCVSGAYCINAHSSATPGVTPSDCRPFLCRSGACLTSCRDVRDCASPAVCSESGRCIQPPGRDAVHGCAVTCESQTSNGHPWWTCVALFSAVALRRRGPRA